MPDLPGCFSAGDTAEEAFDNVREAIEAYCEVPGRLLKQIDHYAKEHGQTRSGFLTQAALDAMRRA